MKYYILKNTETNEFTIIPDEYGKFLSKLSGEKGEKVKELSEKQLSYIMPLLEGVFKSFEVTKL